MVALW